MKTHLLNINHAVTESEPLTEAIPNIGYLIFQWAYILLIIILFILAIASVFGIFKPKPKVYQDDKEDYLSSDHFKKYL